MKRIAAFVFLVVSIFTLAGCHRAYIVSTAGVGTNATGFVTALEDGTVSYNEVELVYEGTDRAKELGIENMDNGYVIYDPDAKIETAIVSTDVEFYLQRWNEDNEAFEPVAVSEEEFQLELESRLPDGILCILVLDSYTSRSGQGKIVSGFREYSVP